MITTGWFVAPIVLVALWEAAAPRRRPRAGRALRWPTSFTLAPLNALLVSVPITPVALAAVTADRSWGVLDATALPAWLATAAAVPLLDLLVYVQHRVLHAAPALWSFHRVHHADVEFDYTTGLRFHPVEALVTHATLLAGVVAFGLPALGVAVYQVLATAMTLFEHANGRLPAPLEARVRRVLVTPELHRIHHSTVRGAGGNFATIFSLWDRAFGTDRHPPAGDEASDVGLVEFRDPKYATLPWTLALPFLPAGRVGQDTPKA